MNILAYFISSPVSAFQGVGSHDKTSRILFGSRITNEEDELEETFGALHKRLPFIWNNDEKYDTVNPFGDARQLQYHALWTFDTQNDVLRYTNRECYSQIPLALLRERLVSLDDMRSFGRPVPLSLEPTFDPGMPYRKPKVEVDDRIIGFTHRLLRDFYHQWKHILRNHYNSLTLRVLARAIIRLATLDFEVRPNTGGRGPRGVHVWITQLPAWEPFETNFVRVGNVHVVLCQTIQKGLLMAQNHASSQDNHPTNFPADSADAVHYLILSVKHVMLCHVRLNSLEHTAPEHLFNGDYDIAPPSDLALNYLTWATASARPADFSHLHSLPIEVQDVILDHLSGRTGTVVAAKVGCLLGLGSPFLWKDGPLKLTLEERYLNRPLGSPVESHVWFGERKSGIIYLAR